MPQLWRSQPSLSSPAVALPLRNVAHARLPSSRPHPTLTAPSANTVSRSLAAAACDYRRRGSPSHATRCKTARRDAWQPASHLIGTPHRHSARRGKYRGRAFPVRKSVNGLASLFRHAPAVPASCYLFAPVALCLPCCTLYVNLARMSPASTQERLRALAAKCAPSPALLLFHMRSVSSRTWWGPALDLA